jgi:hypothetical protein
MSLIEDIAKTAAIAISHSAAFLLMLAIGISVSKAETNCVPAPSGLVSWWRGESNLADQTGGNNGTIIGDPMVYVPGKVGEAFNFLGDDLIEVGAATNLQLQDFSIEGWIKILNLYSGDGNGAMFGFGEGGYQFGVNSDNGTLYLAVTAEDEVESTNKITDTNYHHLAITKSGMDVVGYIDGVGCNLSSDNAVFTFNIGTYGAGIGAESDNGDTPFVGEIDELSVYNRPLTVGEIEAIYNAGSAGKCLTLGAPFIFDEPTNLTIFGGSPATFAVVANGAQPLTYQWLFDGTNIFDATNATLSFTNAQPSEAGTYSVILSNSYGVLASSNAVLTVDLIPDILSQPTNEAVGAYYPVLFSVGAVGPLPLLYQWTFDGTNLTGATNSTLFFGAALPSEAGTYSVIVGTAPNVTNSSNAVLTVILPPAPTILTQPASHIGVVADYTTFTVAAQSPAPAPTSYQWSFAGTNLPGATNTELIISNLTMANAGTYAVQVSNPFFASNSQPAVLTMIPAPTGTNRIVANLDPNELTKAVGAGGSVTFVCSGTITLSEPIAVGRDVVVEGSNTITLSGAGRSQLLTIPSGVSVALRDLTISGGLATNGGAISNGGTLTLEAVNSSGNDAAWMGGALFNAGTAMLTSVVLSNNESFEDWIYAIPGRPPYPGNGEGLGGAIYNIGTLSLTNVIFSGNEAEGSGSSSAYGGGIFNSGGTISLSNVVFDGNVAEGGSADGNFVAQGWGFGGALCSSGGSITGNDIGCTNNAALSGNGDVSFEQPFFPTGQPGAGQGGAIFLSNCVAVLTNGWFASNSTSCSPAYNEPQVDSEGGAVFNAGWTTLVGVDFMANICEGTNGVDGRTLSGDTDTTQQGGNGAGGIGGAIYNLGLLALTNCTFTGNSVTGGSGGPGNTCYACTPVETGPSGNPGNALGGALANFGTLDIFSNAFLNNSTIGPGTDVGTIYNVGNMDIDASTTISPDTVDNNPGAFAPFLALEPQSQTVIAGTTVTLVAVAVGSPDPTYQWSWDGTNIASAAAQTLVLTNIQLSQSGTYKIEATNAVGSDISAPIVLTIVNPPPITLTGSIGSGGFSISSPGISGLSFVLEVSTNLLDWQPLSTNSSPVTFIDTNTSASPSRYYRTVIAH